MNIAEQVNQINQLFMKGDVDAAIKEYRYLLSLKPDDQIIKENLALALTSKGRLDEAEEVLKGCPSSSSVNNLFGNVYFYKRDYAKAKGYYEKAVELDHNCGDAWSNLGNIYCEFKEFNKAEDCYRKAIQLNSKNPYWHSNLGKVLFIQGKIEQAIESYKKCLMINPGLKDIQNVLCNIYDGLVGAKLLANDYTGAYSLYAECKKYCPNMDLTKYPHLCRIK